MAPTKSQRIAQVIKPYGEKYGRKSDDHGGAFEGFVADVLAAKFGIADPNDDLAEAILRSNDMGIDVVLELPDGEPRLVIVQCKYGKRRSSSWVTESKGFFDLHSRLKQGAAGQHSNEEVRRLLGAYADKFNDGYSVELIFAVSTALEEEDAIRETARLKNDDLEGVNVRCHVFDGNELLDQLEVNAQSAKGAIPDVKFKVQRGQMFTFDDPRSGLVARLAGNELRGLLNDKKEMLFERNIRFPITSQINTGLRETLKGAPDDFFFFNNGISATCSDFDVDESTNIVTARRFQIINGAQTMRALADTPANRQHFVLFRLTATGEAAGGTFTDRVTRFNNTQNPVKEPDFRSNDPIQLEIAELISERSGKGALGGFAIWYERKRGMKAPSGRQGKKVTKEELGGSRHSFLQGPVPSFRTPKNLWSDEKPMGLYWEAFGSDGEPCSSWSDEEQAQAIVALAITLRQRQRHAEKRAQYRNDDDPPAEVLFLSRLARYVTALVGVALTVARENGEFHDWAELASSHKRFEELVKEAENCARRLIAAEYQQRRANGEVQPEYNLGRSDKTWEMLRKLMRDEARELYG